MTSIDQGTASGPLSKSDQTRRVLDSIAALADIAATTDHGNLVAMVQMIGAQARSIKITRWCHQCGEWPMEPDDADRMCASCRDGYVAWQREEAQQTAESDRHDTVTLGWAQ